MSLPAKALPDDWVALFGSKPSSPIPRVPVSPQPGSPPYFPGSVANRSVAVQAAPTPWTRFFFPEELGSEQSGALNPLFHYFDVHLATELSAEEMALTQSPPQWMPEAYMRLSFINMRGKGDDKVVAHDITQGGSKLLRQGGEEHLAEVDRFCRLVARFRPRTWADTEPLVSLMSGVVLYLLGQLYSAADVAAAKLRVQYDVKMQRMQQEEAAKYASMLERERSAIVKEYEERLMEIKTEAAQAASEELGALIHNAQLTAAESREQTEEVQRKLDETLQLLENSRGNAKALAEQLAEEKCTRDAFNKNLMDEQKQLQKHVGRLETQVAAARMSSLASVRVATTEQEVWATCASALQTLTGATHAYCAELALVDQDGDCSHSTPHVPATALEQHGASATPPSEELGADPAATAAGPGADSGSACISPGLQFRYVAAGAGSEFMVGQYLPQGSGVSWALHDPAKPMVHIPDTGVDTRVCFFRAPFSRAYNALAVRGEGGKLIGMLCYEATAAADVLEEGAAEGDLQFAQQLAAAATQAMAAAAKHKQEMLEAAAIQMADGTDSETAEHSCSLEELEQYGDLPRGRSLLAEACRDLLSLGPEAFNEITSLPDCGTSAWAILRAAISLVSEQPLTLDSWSQLRLLVNVHLIDQLATFDPGAPNAKWSHLRVLLQDTLSMTELEASGQGALMRALLKYVIGLRKVSAGLALEQVLQDKLGKANKAVERALLDARADALAELKSYRIAPKFSFKVLKAVLLCLGHTAAETETWGQCRGLASRSMVKKMLGLKPKSLPMSKVREARATVKGLTEESVKNESLASLLLYKWLAVVLQVAATHRSVEGAATE